jgi:hypothetical protein
MDSPLDDSLERADCCIARGAYRVVLAPRESRPRQSDLVLCRHHYRVSADALRHSDASVYDASGRLVSSMSRAMSAQ